MPDRVAFRDKRMAHGNFSHTVTLGEGRVFRVQLPGDSGQFSFFSVLQNVCVKDSFYNGPLRLYSRFDPLRC